MGKRKRKSTPKSSRTRRSQPTAPIVTYEVEVILAAKPLPRSNGKHYLYLVRWYGYPGEDTYEPYQNVKDLDRLLMSFWREIGPIDPSNTKELRPSREWIEAEVRYFRETYKQHDAFTADVTIR